MSQEEVFKILKILGGRATTKEITDYARENYPSLTLYMYTTKRLKQLQRSGFIRRTINENIVNWEIIKKFK